MIVSFRHKFIFVAVPKTGTHSIRQALRPHLGADDMEQARLFVEKQFPIEALARLGHGHFGFADVKPFLDEQFYAEALKFAFVRNPFDRFVSYCAFVTTKDGAFRRDPRRVMRHFLLEAPPHNHIIFKPQFTFLLSRDGAMMADKVAKVESMQQDFDQIAAQIGIATATLEHANRSAHDDYRSYYDQQLIDGVARIYARDLELFGYDF